VIPPSDPAPAVATGSDPTPTRHRREPPGNPPEPQVHRSTATLFYYRPIAHVHHGQTQYVTTLLHEMRARGNTVLVAPEEARDRAEKNAYLGMVRNLFVTQVAQLLHFAKGLRGRRPDEVMVVVDAYSGFLPLLWNRLTRCPMVYVASDPAALYAHSLKASGIPGSLLLRTLRAPIERQLVKHSRLVVVRSRWMLGRLVESGCPDNKLRVLPHPPQVSPPDLPSISAVQLATGLAGKVAVVFLGDFEYPPNAESADYLLKSVLPKLMSQAPSARLVFAGPGSEHYRTSASPNLVALGRVSDLSSVLYSCAIGIAPATVAGGTSAKTIDYLAHGLVCLVTPEVARSLDPDPNLHVSSRDRFADELVSLVLETEAPRAAADYFSRRLAGRVVEPGFGQAGDTVIHEIDSLAVLPT
jgi:Glycosyl transferases group 1/Glycosyl transferase 4-like domain